MGKEVRAEKATGLPKLGKPRMKHETHEPDRHENHIISTCFSYLRFRFEIVKFVRELGARDPA